MLTSTSSGSTHRVCPSADLIKQELVTLIHIRRSWPGFSPTDPATSGGALAACSSPYSSSCGILIAEVGWRHDPPGGHHPTSEA